ncbi:hypothetical protein V9L05_18890 [Bernardetia sp. Wsw4-3y2]|uniref:hypothetical protein n=1 Tax=Bernardetia sp. Wsw4-3y2 TaxID=3127471 RepID=UPI0030CBCBE8
MKIDYINRRTDLAELIIALMHLYSHSEEEDRSIDFDNKVAFVQREFSKIKESKSHESYDKCLASAKEYMSTYDDIRKGILLLTQILSFSMYQDNYSDKEHTMIYAFIVALKETK